MSAATSRRERYMRRVAEISDVVGLEDLTMDELAALQVVLTPAHARVLAGQRGDTEQLGRWAP